MAVIQKCEPAQRVFMAVPAYDYKIHIQTASAILGTCGLLSQMNCKVTVGWGGGNCYVDQVRNSLVHEFFNMPGDFTDLFFVDSDVIFEPMTAARLLTCTKPLCAAVYPKKLKALDVGWPLDFADDDVRSTDAEGMIQASLLATGCMRINRQVFLDMQAHTRVEEYFEPDGRMVKRFFKLEVDNQTNKYWGEDFLFCKTWRDIGGKSWLLPDATLGHVGMKMWEGNWGQWKKDQGHTTQAEPAVEVAA